MNSRAVLQKQGEDETFLYYVSSNRWHFSDREDMESGKLEGSMDLISAALRGVKARGTGERQGYAP